MGGMVYDGPAALPVFEVDPIDLGDPALVYDQYWYVFPDSPELRGVVASLDAVRLDNPRGDYYVGMAFDRQIIVAVAECPVCGEKDVFLDQMTVVDGDLMCRCCAGFCDHDPV